MKKLILLPLLVVLFTNLNAQNHTPKSKIGPVKFADALAQHKALAQDNDDDDDIFSAGKNVKEGKNHLAQKWEWYWKQHLDKNGYMVPTNYNIGEWQRYLNNHATKKAAKTTSSYPSDWVFMGPFTTAGGYAGIGRISNVAFDPIDSNTIYAGAAAGGTWKSTNGGNTWTSLYDFLPTLGVTDIKINPRNHNTIYVATGDADHWDAYCSGVIKSYNGGLTWDTTGLHWLPTAYYSARSLIINPLDTNSMVLATNGGIFKTYDAGATWTNLYWGDFIQILYKPTDTNIIYGSIYASNLSQLVRSVDGGYTWDTVTSFTDAQRINIAVTPANPNLVAAVVSNTSSGLEGIYTSTNSGATYGVVFYNDTTCVNNILSGDMGLPSSSCGGQGWYDLCIAIDPTNANNFTVGGVNTYSSTDGGVSWQIATTWYWTGGSIATVHADKHWLAYNPLTNALFEGCDGGVYKTYDPLFGGWINLCSGLCVTEFYRNAVANGADFCIGGAQDNGTKYVSTAGCGDLTGGDGMQPLINYGDPTNVFYTSYQNGTVNITRDGGVNFTTITDTLHSSGGWVTPYSLHPTDTGTLLLGYKNVFVSYNNGLWWYPISPVFDSNSYLNIVQIANSNPNYIYTEYDDYNIWKSVINYTTDFGTTWDTISIPFTNFISDLVIDPRNENQIWVTVSGYSATDKVYKYDLLANTWTNEAGSLPNLPVNCVLIDTSNQTKYIGTDAAIYVKDTTMADWVLFNNNLPTVHVTDLNINYDAGIIWAATFGRGMWKSNKSNVPTQIPNIPKSTKGFNVSPNPSHGYFMVSTTDLDLVNETVDIRLINAAGKQLLKFTGKFDAGGKIKINTQDLPAGFYICEISNAKTTTRSKVIIY